MLNSPEFRMLILRQLGEQSSLDRLRNLRIVDHIHHAGDWTTFAVEQDLARSSKSESALTSTPWWFWIAFFEWHANRMLIGTLAWFGRRQGLKARAIYRASGGGIMAILAEASLRESPGE